MRVKIKWNGIEVSANTWEALVKEIQHTTLFFPDVPMQEYMEGVAGRGDVIGKKIRTDSPEHFIQDMIDAGVLEMIKENKKIF